MELGLSTPVCLSSPPAAPALTEPQLPAAGLKPDRGEGSRALRPDPGRAQGVGPQAPPHLPEPLNDRMVWAVAVLVNGVLPPVVHVHVAEAAHQQLGRRETRCER